MTTEAIGSLKLSSATTVNQTLRGARDSVDSYGFHLIRLITAPRMFQLEMTIILLKFRCKFALLYLDDMKLF